MELNEKVASLYTHLYAAKKELENMNIGKAHDEIVAAISIELKLTEDESKS